MYCLLIIKNANDHVSSLTDLQFALKGGLLQELNNVKEKLWKVWVY